MSAGTFPKPSLRPYLDSDLPSLSETRFAAIEELTAEDYDQAQRQAWASLVDDDEAFAQTLVKGLTLVAQIGWEPVGFITLHDGGVIDQVLGRDCPLRSDRKAGRHAWHSHTCG